MNQFKRLLAFLLAAVLMLGLFPTLAAASDVPTGDAEPQDPYVFSDEEHETLENDVFASISQIEASVPRPMGGSGSLTEDDYVNLIPAVIQAVERSETYMPGTLQQNGSFLVWQTTVGISCCYDPRMEYELNLNETAPGPALPAAAQNAPTQTDPAEVFLAEEADRGTGEGGTMIGLIQPFWESEKKYDDDDFLEYSPAYKATWQNLCTATGGTGVRYSMYDATVDNIADTIERCNLVIIDSHGSTDYKSGEDMTSRANTSYLCLTTARGITAEDTVPHAGPYNTYYNALKGSKYAYVNGDCIAAHMDRNAPHSMLYMGICLGMATDKMFTGLRARGVEVVYGYSQTVTFRGDLLSLQSVAGYLIKGKTAGYAIEQAQKDLGCQWDAAYSEYSLTEEAARENRLAFPVVVSSEDAYPGHGNVDRVLTAHSSWTLTKAASMSQIKIGGILDGRTAADVSEYGTYDVYINGKIVANDVTYYCDQWPTGSSYQIRDIRPTSGHAYNGFSGSALSGTLGTSGVSLSLQFSTVNSSRCLTLSRTEMSIPYHGTGTINVTVGGSLPKNWSLKYVISDDIWNNVVGATWEQDWNGMTKPLQIYGASEGNAILRIQLINKSNDSVVEEVSVPISVRRQKLDFGDIYVNFWHSASNKRLANVTTASFGQALQLTSMTSGTNASDVWHLVPLGEGLYHIVSEYDGKLLTASMTEATTEGLNAVYLSTDRGDRDRSQVWYFAQNSGSVDGSVVLMNVEAGRVLDLCGTSLSDGSYFQVDDENDSDNSQQLIPAPAQGYSGLKKMKPLTIQSKIYGPRVEISWNKVSLTDKAWDLRNYHVTVVKDGKVIEDYNTTKRSLRGNWSIGKYHVTITARNRRFSENRPGATVTAAISFSIKTNVENPFVDVKKSDYFYEPVLWAFYHEPQVTAGTNKTHFSPSDTCTREQVVTFLWRAAGCPKPKTKTCPFKDVKKGAYYEKAVLWAVEKGVTQGTSKTKFGVGEPCTRGQVVTFLWRAKGSPAPKTSKNPFKDVGKKDYFYQAVLWAVEKGITAGSSKTKFSPADTCTRGQIVTFLYRAYS